MDFKSFFFGLLGVSSFINGQKTSAPTTSIEDYRVIFSDLLVHIAPENREWWLNQIKNKDPIKSQPFPMSQVKTIQSIVNTARRSTNPSAASMRELTWNYALESKLLEYRNNNNASVFYSINHLFPRRIQEKNRGLDLFGSHLIELKEFQAFWPNCDYWWHDTNFKGNEVNIVKMRAIKQKDCFNYSRCNTTSFGNFYSCITPNGFNPRQPCSFANRYYGNIVREELESFAGIRLGIPGAFTPNRQPDAAWYFACTSTPFKRSADIPYVSGPRASACPNGFIAQSGLCHKQEEKSVTNRPTLYH